MNISAQLTDYVAAYDNTASVNDAIHAQFTQHVNSVEWLKTHRDWIEANRLGFGDRAFHYLWYLLVRRVAADCLNPHLLEIGVYKGQVISLWSLIAKQCELSLKVTAISPLQGNPPPQSRFQLLWRQLTSVKFHNDQRVGNLYEEMDYQRTIEDLFRHFGLDFAAVNLIRGFSQEAQVIEKARTRRYAIVYIDGDHSYDGVRRDIYNFAGLVIDNGYLVMDDASYYLPGSTFWKGHETVSRACDLIPSLGFVNILNVGHNRIYQKRAR